jgi:hypothetical protein
MTTPREHHLHDVFSSAASQLAIFAAAAVAVLIIAWGYVF